MVSERQRQESALIKTIRVEKETQLRGVGKKILEAR
jgi:hypothetical protein